MQMCNVHSKTDDAPAFYSTRSKLKLNY